MGYIIDTPEDGPGLEVRSESVRIYEQYGNLIKPMPQHIFGMTDNPSVEISKEFLEKVIHLLQIPHIAELCEVQVKDEALPIDAFLESFKLALHSDIPNYLVEQALYDILVVERKHLPELDDYFHKHFRQAGHRPLDNAIWCLLAQSQLFWRLYGELNKEEST